MKGYRIEKQIGQTGMSTLYYAVKDTDNSENISYLIKKYYKNVSDDMINNERETSQIIEESCSYSLTIPILEGTQENGDRCVAMQFRKNGLFLNEIIERLESQYGNGKIPLYIILEITSKILETLSVFHEYEYEGEKKGYLHLDLNPGNIFFESADLGKQKWGNVKFIDFVSSVSCKDKDEILTERNWFCFSEMYSPREILENIIPHINKSSDLFSVCACMLRMIVGRTFSGICKKNLEDLSKKYNLMVAFFLKNIIENASCEPAYYRYEEAKMMQKDVERLLKCLSWEKEGDYYNLLILCYEYSVPAEMLFSEKNMINKENILHAFLILKENLNQDMIHYGKCLYVFEGLLKLVKKSNIVDKKIESMLVECGLSCYNNTGHTMKAVKLYERYGESFFEEQSCSIQSYITTQIKYAVSLADCYEFNKAYEVTCDIIKGMEIFKKTCRGQFSKMMGITELGRAYSAAGTYLAFLKKDNPMLWYKKALDEFKGDVGNCRITYSKILHYAIDMKDKELYEKYAQIYFDKNGFTPEKENLQKFMEMEAPSYDVFLYLKGINAFYWEDAGAEFYNMLEQFLAMKQFFRKQHPEQLILKYSALLLYKSGEKEKSERVFLKSLQWIEEGRIGRNKPMNIMMLMSYQTAWIRNELKGEDNQQLLEEVIWQCKKFSWKKLKEKIETENTLSNILCHEYC